MATRVTPIPTTRPASPPAHFALLSCALLVLVHVAVLANAPRWEPLPSVFLLGSLLLTAGPYAALAVGLRRSSTTALVAARALGAWAGRIVAIVVFGSILLLVGRLVFFIVPMLFPVLAVVVAAKTFIAALGVAGTALLALFVAVQRQLARVTVAALALESPKPAVVTAASLLAIVYVVGLAPLALRAQHSRATDLVGHAEGTARRMELDPAVARRALMRVQRCAIAHAAATQGNSFPATLDALGPAGDRCLDDAVAHGRVNGWKLAYLSGPTDSVGIVHTFTVAVVPPEDYPRNDDRVVGDQAGVVYSVSGGDSIGVGARGRVTDSPVQRMREFALCIVRERWTYRLDGFPSEIGDRGPNGSWGCLGPNAGPKSPRSRVVERAGPVGEYDIAYVPGVLDAAGHVWNFTVEARPRTYGQTGLRSFLLDESGAIHHTPEDRAATRDDPLVPACEGRSGARCVVPR